MAIFPTKKSSPPLFLTLLLLLLLTTTSSTAAISTRTLDTVLTLLRTNSHALFANAIATSDLLFDLLSLPSATLLCPPDPQIFALDMASLSPISYTSSLRAHVIPNSSLTRLTIPPPHTNSSSSNTRNTASVYHTLLPWRDLHVTRDSLSGVVTVDGVGVVLPRLYYSREVSVFRLRGILPPEYVPAGGSTAPPPPVVQNLNPTISSPVVPAHAPESFSAPPPADRKMIAESNAGAPEAVKAPVSSFAAAPGPGEGRFSGRNGGDQKVVERKGGDDVEECGALDGERRMQCAVRDVRHVSIRDSDYASLT